MLEIYRGECRLLALRGPWLYPIFLLFRLFELLGASGLRPANSDGERLNVVDSRVGQAAVFLYAQLGITTVHAVVASRLALERASALGVTLTYEQLLPELPCKTEALLSPVRDPAEAVALLRRRLSDPFLSDPGSVVELDAASDPQLEAATRRALEQPYADR